MNPELRPTMLLSSLVHTRSMELVLAPIASQVSQLMILTETRGSTPFPDLMPSACAVMEAVQNLASVAQKCAMETADELFQVDMPVAYSQVLAAGQTLLEAAGRLSEDSTSLEARPLLMAAGQRVLEGTMKVLLVWDDGEVRKILRTADWVLDRLSLVQGAKSMRGLVICFGGLSESLKLLLSLADNRQKELTSVERKREVISSLDRLKEALPKFSTAMQNYVKQPTSNIAKESKDALAGEISDAVHDLMNAVKTFDDVYVREEEEEESEEEESEEEEEKEETENMAANIVKVHRQLAPTSRYFIGPKLDQHIDAVVQNSMAVAHVSRDKYREVILRLCSETLTLRKELGDNLTAVHANPESEEARAAFDRSAEQLCEKLCEVDRWVADAVVDQVTDTFVETSAPINHLVQAATATPTATPTSSSPGPSSSSPSSSQLDESLKGLTKQVELFRRHSRKLSQVAAYAAQSSTDSKRVQKIKDLADEVDQLTPRVVAAALDVRKTPSNRGTRQHLDSLRREWAGKVQELTGAIDDVIDPEDFMAVSESNIHKDMAKCRDAVQSENWAELVEIVHGIAAKARRVVEVGRMAAGNTSDPNCKRSLDGAVKRLERAIPKMITLANDLINNPSSQTARNQFVLSLREILESIHQIQSALHSRTTTGKPAQIMGDEAHKTSTPLPSAQEKRQMEQLRTQSRYIGSLAATQRPTRQRMLPTPPRKVDGGVQTSPQGLDEPDIFIRPRVGASPQRPDSIISFSEGFSYSYSSGDAETQTPRHRTKDQSSQADMKYPSVTFGSPPPSMVSPTFSATSWTSPKTTPTSRPPTTQEDVASPSTDKTIQSYASPLQKLVTAAKTGDTDQLRSQASALHARTIRLTGIAESAAAALKHNAELSRVLQEKASEVSRLTPQVIEQAEKVANDPQQREKLDELHATTLQWAGHVRQLIDATQDANLPWSMTAKQLVVAAKSGEALEAQTQHVSTQTTKMVDIATMTIEAAETEEAIGSTDESNSQDQEFQEQVQHVKVMMSEIQKLTPQLLSAAEMSASQGGAEGTAGAEHLKLLSQEWATKAKMLMKGVDDVTLGMGGPADTLLISAKSGDPGLLEEQSKAISDLASSLQDIAQDAVKGCSDVERVRVVTVAAHNTEKLSAQLIDCANVVARAGEEGGEASQLTIENTELLRRQWASQVHLLTAHIDDLTAGVAAPLDRLVDLALQASRTSGVAKQHLLSQFEGRASYLTDHALEEVSTLFDEATRELPQQQREEAVYNVATAISFLRKLTPHAVGAARSLATDPGSAMLDHFNHLRRQWAAKAQFLQANLKSITTVDVGRVLAAFDDLLHSSKVAPGKDGLESPPLLRKSYSIEGLNGEKSSEFEGMIEVKQPSTPKAKSHSRKYSEQEEDVAQLVLRPPHRTKRPTSMSVPLPSWVAGGEEDSFNVSSQSIAVAAQSLREVTDEFLEEGNPIVTVAKKMSQQMFQMAEFTHGRGELQSKSEMIHTAKAIAANGQMIVRFANHISEQCMDKRIKANLQYCAEMIPTLSTQLRIIASVKASTPDDTSADVMLVKNAENLMQAVIKTVQAAESACMKGLNPPEDSEQTEAAALALSWKRKLYHQRTMEAITAPLGARGLRKLNRNRISTPSLVDVIQPRPTSPTSYVPK